MDCSQPVRRKRLLLLPRDPRTAWLYRGKHLSAVSPERIIALIISDTTLEEEESVWDREEEGAKGCRKYSHSHLSMLQCSQMIVMVAKLLFTLTSL